MEFGTSKEIELLDSSEGDPSVSDARQTQHSKQVQEDQKNPVNSSYSFMPPVTSASATKRPQIVQVEKQNEPMTYKMPPINSFTSLGQ